MLPDFPVIHAVTDSAALRRDDFPATAESVMRALGSRGALHLRGSRIRARRFHELAELLAPLQGVTGCWLIVNDRADVGRAVAARGIQLASHSLTVGDAKRVAADIPVGTSIHSVEEARAAESAGADWVVAGTVFDTPSHAGQPGARIPFVQAVVAAVKVPVIAIGGVTPENVAELIQAGAYGVATIRGADWARRLTSEESRDMLHETRLDLPVGGAAREPITRYISEYDSVAGNGRDDHTHREWRTPEAPAK